MTRRLPVAANPGAVTHAKGNAPPPSTLAAKIVQNQHQPAADSGRDGEAATFTQLLHDILHSPAVIQETDVNVNLQLINVVAEAGLTPLAQDNPFTALTDLIPRAVDSLAVIERTLRHQPGVLLTPIGKYGPQLALPLLARLIAICGRPSCKDVPAAALLNAAIEAADASPEVWQSAKVLRQVCRDLVDGT